MASDYLITFISLLLQIFQLAIFIRILAGWVDPQAANRATQVLHEITEPILGPIRRIMPQMGMFDFSPIIAVLLLNALGQIVLTALSGSR